MIKFHRDERLNKDTKRISRKAVKSKRSARKCKHSKFTTIIFGIHIFIVSVVMLLGAFSDGESEAFTFDVDKCPACFGISICSEFKDGNIIFRQSSFSVLTMFEPKTVFSATFFKENIVVKKLATQEQLKEIDKLICNNSGESKYACIISEAITHLSKSYHEKSWIPKESSSSLGKVPGLLSCPSLRLIKRLTNATAAGHLSVENLLYLLHVNSEPILQQTFPASEGWPFARYLGACGRNVVVSAEGEPLHHFRSSSWQVRAKIVLALFAVAEKLTYATGDWALYLTDPSWENLHVVEKCDKSTTCRYSVVVVDAENIIVVDKKLVAKEKPRSWEFPHSNDDSECYKVGNCIGFDRQMLCSRQQSDFNYYAVCKTFLSQWADYGGFLDGMSETAKMKRLADNCAYPRIAISRESFANDLIVQLENALVS